MTSTGKRTGAEPPRAHRPAITRAAVLLALGATIGLSAQAYAQTIRFDNPSGPGHWGDWSVVPGEPSIFLNITLPANQQPSTAVSGSFGHTADVSGGTSWVDPAVTGQLRGTQNGRQFILRGFLEGETIPGPESWGSSSGFAEHPSHTTFFPEGEERYVGVQFDLGGGFQFGWIGVVRESFWVETFAWGYEQTPGVPIQAGVPAPASVALLGLGGLIAARRRR